MIIQIGIIFLFLGLGELIVMLTGLPIPSSILGMLLLSLSLTTGILDFRHVEKSSNFLVKNLGFFFIPAGVGLINCFGLIRSELVPIVVAVVASTAVVIFVTGHTFQIFRRHSSRRRNHSAVNGIVDR